jgi:hypothetical protein
VREDLDCTTLDGMIEGCTGPAVDLVDAIGTNGENVLSTTPGITVCKRASTQARTSTTGRFPLNAAMCRGVVTRVVTGSCRECYGARAEMGGHAAI